MRRGRRKRRHETRRTDDKGRWAKRIARDDLGSLTVVATDGSVRGKPKPRPVRRAS